MVHRHSRFLGMATFVQMIPYKAAQIGKGGNSGNANKSGNNYLFGLYQEHGIS